MVCPNCGYTNQPSNRFCVRCGIDTAASLAPDQEPAPATARPDASPPPPATVLPDASPPPPPPPAPPSPWGVPSAPAGPPPATATPPGMMPPPPGAPGPPPGAPNPFAPPPPAAPPGYPQWGYGQYPPPYPPSGSWAPQSTNGLAVASLVLGIVGWLACGIGSVLAIIFGFVAQGQIRESQGRQGGAGMARAGIILGFVGVALLAVFIMVSALSGSSQS